MATRFSGKQAVESGSFFGTSHLAGKGGAQETGARRGPPSRWLLLAAPFVGLVYVVTLPVVALVTVGHALARRLTGRVVDGAADLAATVAPDVATGAAYLAGHEGGPKAGAPEHPELEKLAKELEEKRR